MHEVCLPWTQGLHNNTCTLTHIHGCVCVCVCLCVCVFLVGQSLLNRPEQPKIHACMDTEAHVYELCCAAKDNSRDMRSQVRGVRVNDPIVLGGRERDTHTHTHTQTHTPKELLKIPRGIVCFTSLTHCVHYRLVVTS